MAKPIRAEKDGELGFVHTIDGEQRFIADTDDPGAEPGALQAGLISAGRTAAEIPTRAAAAFGDEAAQAEITQADELFASLNEARPVATAVGSAVPAFAVPGGKLAQIAAGAVEGALANPESPFTGAASGAAFGLVGQKVGDEIGAAATRKLQEMSRSTARRATARAARTVESAQPGLGSALTVGERTGSRAALSAERAAETALGRSLRGGRRQTNLNRQFDKALGGQGVDQLTGDVLGGHSARIGSVFESAAKGVDEIPISQEFSDALGDIAQKASDEAANPRALKQLEIIGDISVGDKMTGKQYLRIRTRLGKISRNEWSPGGDAVSGELVDDMIGALDDMFAEASPEIAAKLGDARAQWRLLTAARKGAALDPSGNVNPNSMQTALESVFPGVDRANFSPGATGQAQALNAASQRFPVEASSRTAERLISSNPARLAISALLNVGGGAGGQVGGGVAREVGIPLFADDQPAQ